MSLLSNIKTVAKYVSPTTYVADWIKDKAEDPNFNLIPGVSINNRPGERDVNPWNKQPGGNTPTPKPPGDGSIPPPPGGNTGYDNNNGGSQTSYDPYAAQRAAAAAKAAAQEAAQKAADISAAQQAYDSANFDLGRIGNQRNIGLDNITNSFTNYRNSLNAQKGRSERDYTTNRNQTISGYEQARSQINDMTRQKAQGLQRWLANFGAGDSQMSNVMAPYAAARVGSQQKAQQENTFSHNLGQMDTGWNDYMGQYNDQLNQSAQQEREKRQALEAQMQQKQYEGENARSQARSALTYAQSGNSALATQQRESALNGMRAILAQIDNLQRQYANPVNLTAPTFAPIDVAKYVVDRTPAIQGDVNTPEEIDPSYQNLILKKQEQDNLGY